MYKELNDKKNTENTSVTRELFQVYWYIVFVVVVRTRTVYSILHTIKYVSLSNKCFVIKNRRIMNLKQILKSGHPSFLSKSAKKNAGNRKMVSSLEF